MGTLTYSHTLTAGTTENINDVQDMFNDAKTLLNGNLDGYNAPNLLTQYRLVQAEKGLVTAASITGAITMVPAAASGYSASTSANGLSIIRIAAANWSLTGLTTKMRTTASIGSNASAQGINFTFGLYPITAIAGGAAAVTFTLGAVTAGSTVAINAPAASAITTGASADFTIPADGNYVLGFATSGAAGANSAAAIAQRLELRWTA